MPWIARRIYCVLGTITPGKWFRAHYPRLRISTSNVKFVPNFRIHLDKSVFLVIRRCKSSHRTEGKFFRVVDPSLKKLRLEPNTSSFCCCIIHAWLGSKIDEASNRRPVKVSRHKARDVRTPQLMSIKMPAMSCRLRVFRIIVTAIEEQKSRHVSCSGHSAVFIY